jgi:hypothetical protein
MEGINKIMKIFSQEIRYLVRTSNRTPQHYRMVSDFSFSPSRAAVARRNSNNWCMRTDSSISAHCGRHDSIMWRPGRPPLGTRLWTDRKDIPNHTWPIEGRAGNRYLEVHTKESTKQVTYFHALSLRATTEEGGEPWTPSASGGKWPSVELNGLYDLRSSTVAI